MTVRECFIEKHAASTSIHGRIAPRRDAAENLTFSCSIDSERSHRPHSGSKLRDNEIKIETGMAWVEGDNHSCSLDSNNFGPVPLALVRSKATHVIYPMARRGPLESELPDEAQQRLTKRIVKRRIIIEDYIEG